MTTLQRQTSAYARAHEAVRAARGAPGPCEDCRSTRNCQWANVSGEYLGVEDYRPLCASCHKRQDLRRAHDRREDHPYDAVPRGLRTRCLVCERRGTARRRARRQRERARA